VESDSDDGLLDESCFAPGMGGRDFKKSRFSLITHDLSPFFPHHV
jgi:hypothetical protein